MVGDVERGGVTQQMPGELAESIAGDALAMRSRVDYHLAQLLNKALTERAPEV
ncbi:hypothetical protein [Saccharopolyspora hattusasensis]|uniref:hypothetical protein n=1 Tax=Saccharopolyspora hattusasensis TaxID=1128679 RepID=UPI003D987A85